MRAVLSHSQAARALGSARLRKGGSAQRLPEVRGAPAPRGWRSPRSAVLASFVLLSADLGGFILKSQFCPHLWRWALLLHWPAGISNLTVPWAGVEGRRTCGNVEGRKEIKHFYFKVTSHWYSPYPTPTRRFLEKFKIFLMASRFRFVEGVVYYSSLVFLPFTSWMENQHLIAGVWSTLGSTYILKFVSHVLWFYSLESPDCRTDVTGITRRG